MTETNGQYPLQLGDPSTGSVYESLSEADARAMPLAEVELITRMARNGLSARFWECYRELRRRGYQTKKSALIAWKAAGYNGHGKLNQESYAALLGMSRRTLIRQLQLPDVATVALALQMEWLRERVPSVDDALYLKASNGDVAAIKLYYQRARVAMSGEDAEPQDAWMQALDQARKDAQKED